VFTNTWHTTTILIKYGARTVGRCTYDAGPCPGIGPTGPWAPVRSLYSSDTVLIVYCIVLYSIMYCIVVLYTIYWPYYTIQYDTIRYRVSYRTRYYWYWYWYWYWYYTNCIHHSLFLSVVPQVVARHREQGGSSWRRTVCFYGPWACVHSPTAYGLQGREMWSEVEWSGVEWSGVEWSGVE
jgi:hypothetical protein